MEHVSRAAAHPGHLPGPPVDGDGLSADRYFKLKFGHRGSNHPVKDLVREGVVHITAQNHGYAVDADSMPGSGLKVSHINLNDGTVEGMVHETTAHHDNAVPSGSERRPARHGVHVRRICQPDDGTEGSEQSAGAEGMGTGDQVKG